MSFRKGIVAERWANPPTVQRERGGALHAAQARRAPGSSSDRAPRSTPIPGGGITFPAGALFGSLPIVDSTAGFQIIQSRSAQPESNAVNSAIATVRLITVIDSSQELSLARTLTVISSIPFRQRPEQN